MPKNLTNHLTHPVNPVILSILFITFGHIFGNTHFSKPVPGNLPPDKMDRINMINRIPKRFALLSNVFSFATCLLRLKTLYLSTVFFLLSTIKQD